MLFATFRDRQNPVDGASHDEISIDLIFRESEFPARSGILFAGNARTKPRQTTCKQGLCAAPSFANVRDNPRSPSFAGTYPDLSGDARSVTTGARKPSFPGVLAMDSGAKKKRTEVRMFSPYVAVYLMLRFGDRWQPRRVGSYVECFIRPETTAQKPALRGGDNHPRDH
jgi:hypothetical protein